MPGLADLLYIGQPNPMQQIAQQLQGPNPLGQGGPPPSPAPAQGAGGAASPPAPPGAGGQPPAAPGQPPPRGAPPQPQATQSTPDMASSYQQLANPPNLMSLYLQAAQRQQAEDQINRGFALIAANHAGNPGMARAIMESVSGSQGDPAGQINNLMSLYNLQVQQRNMQTMLSHADEYAAANHMSVDAVRDAILSGHGEDIIKGQMPTEFARDLEAKHQAFINSGGSEEDWKRMVPGLINPNFYAGDMGNMRRAYDAFVNDPGNKGKPVPGYLTDLDKWKIYNADLGDARTAFSGMKTNLEKALDDIGSLRNDERGTLKWAIAHPGAAAGAAINPESDSGQLKNQAESVANELTALAKRGGPKGMGQNLAALGSNPEDFTRFSNRNYEEEVLGSRMKLGLTTLANSYAAAGQYYSMPGYLREYVDPMYKEGGSQDIGGSIPQVTPDRTKTQMTDADRAKFKDYLEKIGPSRTIEFFRNAGYDLSGWA